VSPRPTVSRVRRGDTLNSGSLTLVCTDWLNPGSEGEGGCSSYSVHSKFELCCVSGQSLRSCQATHCCGLNSARYLVIQTDDVGCNGQPHQAHSLCGCLPSTQWMFHLLRHLDSVLCVEELDAAPRASELVYVNREKQNKMVYEREPHCYRIPGSIPYTGVLRDTASISIFAISAGKNVSRWKSSPRSPNNFQWTRA
jgi:hypothetical protein